MTSYSAFEFSGDVCKRYVLPSGLSVYLCEKPKFSSYHAIYGTRYGSIDNCFSTSGEPQPVPNGIAHFLEHKLFESEQCDAFQRYAETGASANAYTYLDRTCYLFGCSNRFFDNLDILLDFVQHPYFTPETVQKEQGIIGQEIRMYEDLPSWRVLVNMLGALYHEHPVKINIAGTEESISEITDKLLYRCYEAFYHPSNMFICIAGNIDSEKVLQKISDSVPSSAARPLRRADFNEPESVLSEYCEERMQVSQPMFVFGIKDRPGRTVRERACCDILMEMIYRHSSPLYKSLIDDELIGEDSGSDYLYGRGYAALMFEGESRSPETVRERILAAIRDMRDSGIDRELFIAAKRRLIGGSVMHLNNVEDIVSDMVECAVGGEDPFDYEKQLIAVEPEEAEALLRDINEKNCALSVVLPK